MSDKKGTQESARIQPLSPAQRDGTLRQNVAQNVRSPLGSSIRSPVMRSPLSKGKSPLSDEIRKMFKEAVADTVSGEGASKTPVLQRSFSGRVGDVL